MPGGELFQYDQQNNKTQQNMINESLQEMEAPTQPYRHSNTQRGPSIRLSRRIEPIRGDLGASIIGPTNPERETQNPDTLAPPQTDHGTLPNLRWSFADSHIDAFPSGDAKHSVFQALLGQGDDMLVSFCARPLGLLGSAGG